MDDAARYRRRTALTWAAPACIGSRKLRKLGCSFCGDGAGQPDGCILRANRPGDRRADERIDDARSVADAHAGERFAPLAVPTRWPRTRRTEAGPGRSS